MKPAFIAEMSCNHCGNYKTALDIIDAAKDIGCWGVKLQCYTPDSLTTDDPSFIIPGGKWKGMKLWDLYSRLQTPREWLPKLFDVIRAKGMVPFASIYHEKDFDFLESIGNEYYKISRFERKKFVLRCKILSAGKTCFISTLGRFDFLDNEIPLFCAPGPGDSPQFAEMRNFRDRCFGISDHSKGFYNPFMSAFLGANYFEFHLATDTNAPDIEISLLPGDAKGYICAAMAGIDAMNNTRPETDMERFFMSNPETGLRPTPITL